MNCMLSIWFVRLEWIEHFIINKETVKKKMCKNNCVSVCSSWQQWIKAILILLYTIFVLIVVPWLIVYTVKDGFTKKDQLILVGGLFVLTSVPFCIWHILQVWWHFELKMFTLFTILKLMTMLIVFLLFMFTFSICSILPSQFYRNQSYGFFGWCPFIQAMRYVQDTQKFCAFAIAYFSDCYMSKKKKSNTIGFQMQQNTHIKVVYIRC